jgi:hypothetical protein
MKYKKNVKLGRIKNKVLLLKVVVVAIFIKILFKLNIIIIPTKNKVL